MTPFSLLCQACGLSHREASIYLDVRPDTVKSWSAGRNPVPDGALSEMATLFCRILDAAAKATDILPEEPADIELGISSDDHEAQTLGWPCVGAHRAVLAIVTAEAIALGHRVKIVPRGSTVATASATEAQLK